MINDAFLADCPELVVPLSVAEKQLAAHQKAVRKLRSSRKYQNLRRSFRLQCAAIKAPCARCLRPILYGVSHRHPASFTVGHTVPVSSAEGLRRFFEVALWRPEHLACGRLGESASAEALGLPADQVSVASEEY